MMLKTELKTVLATLGICLIPFVVQADQSMSSSQMKQAPAYVSGEPVKTGQLPAGYNASAAYQANNGWDLFVTGDYLYWLWSQDSLKVADVLPTTEALGTSESSVFFDPGYKSGFQVGLGFNMPGMDNWNLYSEYTWYRNTNTRSVTNDGSHVFTAVTPLDGTTYYYDGTLSGKAKMHFDALDLLLKRPFYFGRKLTANFGSGLTALWITQKFSTTVSGVRSTTDPETASVVSDSSFSQKQTSWGIGPKFSFESNWILGWGFEIMANLSTSVLYTKYEVNGSASGTAGGTPFSVSVNALNGFGTLRPITEAFIGMGWGIGFCDDEFRIALSAGYDFNVYWDYNMRNFARDNTAGNMYLQGLNVGARFDF